MKLLNTEAIIEQQLTATAPISFEDRTQLTPVTFSPVPRNHQISLWGDWQFDGQVIKQPGKVCYIDPKGQPDSPDWDRVTQLHLANAPSARIAKVIRLTKEFCQNRRVFLRFDAVYPAAKFYLNGALIGEHYSGLTPFQVEITPSALPDTDLTIEVELLRWHPFIQLDMPRHALEYAGIAQEAWCFSTEQQQLRKDTVQAFYDHATGLGRVAGQLTFDGCGSVIPQASLWRLGKKVLDLTVSQAGDGKFDVSGTIERPDLWNDEQPNLYQLHLTCGSDEFEYALGFRQLILDPKGCTLNGNFIKIRGTNIIGFHPDGGLYMPEDWLRKSLDLMKKANINAIRTHLGAPPVLTRLCDELGFYLMQEIPIDWGTHFIHKEAWVGPSLHRIQATVERDIHNPSVTLWGVGNENMPESKAVAEAGWHHLRIFETMMKKIDPSRPALFPPPGPANAIDGIFELRFGDIADVHYSFKLVRDFLEKGECVLPNSWEADKMRITREEALKRGWSGVWFSSEWNLCNLIPDLLNNPSHSLCGDLPVDIFEDTTTMAVFQKRLRYEWDLMRETPSCLGGTIFPWLSCAATTTEGENPWGWMRYSEDADWGVVTANLLPKPEFWALRNEFSPVHFPRKIQLSNDGPVEIPLQNQFNSINLEDCTFRVQTAVATPWMTMQRNFTDIPVSAKPGETGILRVELNDEQKQSLHDGGAVMIRVTLLKPDGFRVTTVEMLVFRTEEKNEQQAPVPIGPDAIF